MKGFIREKPDGRRAAGYLVYLLGGIAALAALALLHRQAGDGGKGPTRAQRTKPSNVASITQPAAVMAPVEVAAKTLAPGTRSYRMEKSGAGPGPSVPAVSAAPAGTFDAIAAALVPAVAENRASDSKSPYAELPPSLPPEVPRDKKGGAKGEDPDDGRVQLFGYRDASADPASARNVRTAGEPVQAGPEYLRPRGSLVCVYLLTTVDTANPSAVIEFAVARTLSFNRRAQLPFGTRILGKLSGRAMRDRLNLVADTLLYPDGLELPVIASAVEADEAGGSIRPGLAADFCPPPPWVRAAPYVSDFFTGALGLLASRAEQPFSVGLAGAGLQAAPSGSLRGPLYQASAQAIQDFTQARLKEMEDRYASHYLVPAGTACWLQLDADLDLAPAHAVHRDIRLHLGPRPSSTPTDAHAPESSN